MKTKLLFLLAISLTVISGCGTSNASSGAYVLSQAGPNGTTCYIIMQGDEVRGGNCEK